MYKILEAGKLAGNIYQMVVEAPRVAKHCLPGQFVSIDREVCKTEGRRFVPRFRRTAWMSVRALRRGKSGRDEKEKDPVCSRRRGHSSGISADEMAA